MFMWAVLKKEQFLNFMEVSIHQVQKECEDNYVAGCRCFLACSFETEYFRVAPSGTFVHTLFQKLLLQKESGDFSHSEKQMSADRSATQDICYTFLIVSRRVLHQVNSSKIHHQIAFTLTAAWWYTSAIKKPEPLQLFSYTSCESQIRIHHVCIQRSQWSSCPSFSASMCHGAPYLYWLEACLISWTHISITLVSTNWPEMMI
jgi:hypothetical protein